MTAKKKTVPSTIYDKHYYLTINDGGALRKQDNSLSPRLAHIADLMRIEPGDAVLDVGCGTGELAYFAAAKGATVWGVDYSKDAVALCERKLGKVPPRQRSRLHFFRSSATRLDRLGIPRGVITKVIMTDIVEHLYPDELEKTMRAIHAIVKDDAIVYIHTAPNLHFYRYGYPVIRRTYPLLRHIPTARAIIETKPNWKGRTVLPKDPEEGSHNKKGHVNEQTPGSLRELCQKTGFSCRVRTLPFLREVQGPKIRAIYAIMRIPPLNFAFCSEIVCIARKRIGR